MTSKQYLAIRQIANEMAQHASLKRPGSLVGEWATRLQEALRSAAETSDELPESLRDPVKMIERGRRLLARHEAATRAAMYEFLGWLSADIPELHSVEVPRLADSWERYRAKIDEPPQVKAACSAFIPMSPYDTEKCANCGATELAHLKTGGEA